MGNFNIYFFSLLHSTGKRHSALNTTTNSMSENWFESCGFAGHIIIHHNQNKQSASGNELQLKGNICYLFYYKFRKWVSNAVCGIWCMSICLQHHMNWKICKIYRCFDAHQSEAWIFLAVIACSRRTRISAISYFVSLTSQEIVTANRNFRCIFLFPFFASHFALDFFMVCTALWDRKKQHQLLTNTIQFYAYQFLLIKFMLRSEYALHTENGDLNSDSNKMCSIISVRKSAHNSVYFSKFRNCLAADARFYFIFFFFRFQIFGNVIFVVFEPNRTRQQTSKNSAQINCTTYRKKIWENKNGIKEVILFIFRSLKNKQKFRDFQM